MKLRGKISLFLIPIIALPMIVLGWVAYGMLQETARSTSLNQAYTFVQQIQEQSQAVAMDDATPTP